MGGQIHAGETRRLEPSVENALTSRTRWPGDGTPSPSVRPPRPYGVPSSKKDLKFFEFAKHVKADEKRERYYRWYLRTIALGLLVRGGTSTIGAARRCSSLDPTAGFVDDPVSRHPVEEIGAASTPPDPRGGVEVEADHSFLPTFRASSRSRRGCSTGSSPRCALKKIADYVMSETYQRQAPELGLG